jgi:hypothetical protein
MQQGRPGPRKAGDPHDARQPNVENLWMCLQCLLDAQSGFEVSHGELGKSGPAISGELRRSQVVTPRLEIGAKVLGTEVIKARRSSCPLEQRIG